MSEAEAARLAQGILARMRDGWGNLWEDFTMLAKGAPTSMRWRAKRARRSWKNGETDVARAWLRALVAYAPP